MGNSLNTAELDAIVAQILDAELKDSELSLRRLAEVSGVKLTRLGDVLRRGRAITTGELEVSARALGLTPWMVLKEAEEAASTLGAEVAANAGGANGSIPEVDAPDAAGVPRRLSIVDGGHAASARRSHVPSLSEIEQASGTMA